MFWTIVLAVVVGGLILANLDSLVEITITLIVIMLILGILGGLIFLLFTPDFWYMLGILLLVGIPTVWVIKKIEKRAK